MKAKAILFDLDGTLLNTNNLVLDSLQYTIREHLGREVEPTTLYKYFGQPLVKIMADLDAGQADDMVRTYREYSAVKHDDLTEVFPEVRETILEMKRRKVPIAVVTSKLKSLALRGLGLFDMAELFDTLVAYEDTDSHKPEPAPVLKALQLLELTGCDQAVMVGDSPYDLLCASKAGIKSAAVGWSLHPRGVLENCCPDIWVDRFSTLLKYV